ncbi:MAG: hypothetical protein R3C46_14705 [Hyphomonadaceae bacterium]
MKFAVAVVVSSLFAGCTSASANPYLACGSAGPDTYYFPAGTFAPSIPPPRLGYTFKPSDFDPDPERRESYSMTMDWLELPSLSCGAPRADETYRLVWLRSFHQPVAIQIDRSGNRYTLDVATSNEARLSGKPLQRIHRQLTKDDWSRIVAGLERIDFWTLPSSDQVSGFFAEDESGDIIVTSAGKDGAEWIIEGRAGHYHAVDRWSDVEDFVAVGRIFIDLAQLNVPEDDIY